MVNQPLGRMEEFTPGSNWRQYVRRLERYFEVNNVPSTKRVPCILTLMGSEMYALLRSISAPVKPKELSFTDIVETLLLTKWVGRYLNVFDPEN